MSTENVVKALVRCRAELTNPTKDAVNPHFKNRYVSLDAAIEHCTPYLAKHGLAILQPVQGGSVKTWALHDSGELLEMGEYPIVAKNANSPQDFGAAVTYARRFGYFAALGIAGADEDDDGNRASGRGKQQRSAPDDTLEEDLKASVKLAELKGSAKNISSAKGLELWEEQVRGIFSQLPDKEKEAMRVLKLELSDRLKKGS